MSILNSNNVAFKSQTETFTEDLSTVHTFWYATHEIYNKVSINVKIDNPDNVAIKINPTLRTGGNDNTVEVGCFDMTGKRLSHISKTGTYICDISRGSFFSLHNTVAAPNATAKVTVKQYIGEFPTYFDQPSFTTIEAVDCTYIHDIVVIDNTQGNNLLMLKIEGDVKPESLIVTSRSP